jgi:hypothetical protein
MIALHDLSYVVFFVGIYGGNYVFPDPIKVHTQIIVRRQGKWQVVLIPCGQEVAPMLKGSRRAIGDFIAWGIAFVPKITANS